MTREPDRTRSRTRDVAVRRTRTIVAGVPGLVAARARAGPSGGAADRGRPSAAPASGRSAGHSAGALVALPADACPVAEVARVVRWLAAEGAGQCGPCVYGLDAIAGALEPTVVRGEPDGINRAVSNLLDNAVKWSPPGGVIELAVHDGINTVRDHGPGFSTADLAHVFERFYRADDARGKPGSGLGLMRRGRRAPGRWRAPTGRGSLKRLIRRS